jgi:chromosome segregation ATPase
MQSNRKVNNDYFTGYADGKAAAQKQTVDNPQLKVEIERLTRELKEATDRIGRQSKEIGDMKSRLEKHNTRLSKLQLVEIPRKCIDCGKEFPFTVGEQSKFIVNGWFHLPKRCEDCQRKNREAKAAAKAEAAAKEKERQENEGRIPETQTAIESTAGAAVDPEKETAVYPSD